MTFSAAFSRFASGTAKAAGKPLTFALGVVAILVWVVTGPLFGYSDAWQLVINTGTTIITFLMVFLIQNSQNRDGAAIQAKLDELIRASAAQNRYIGIEDLSEEELAELRARCASRGKAAKIDQARQAADEAEAAAHEKAARAKDEISSH